LEIEEQDRLRAEKEALPERLRERKRKAEKAKDYLDKLAEIHLRQERLDRLIAWISARKEEGEAIARLLAEAEAYRRVLQHSFEEPSVRSSLEEMGVLGDEEPVMPSLLEPMPPWSWLDWQPGASLRTEFDAEGRHEQIRGFVRVPGGSI
jgi:hypothetical protein